MTGFEPATSRTWVNRPPPISTITFSTIWFSTINFSTIWTDRDERKDRGQIFKCSTACLHMFPHKTTKEKAFDIFKNWRFQKQTFSLSLYLSLSLFHSLFHSLSLSLSLSLFLTFTHMKTYIPKLFSICFSNLTLFHCLSNLCSFSSWLRSFLSISLSLICTFILSS